MTWKEIPLITKTMVGDYPNGVTLTHADMKKVEQRLDRSATLPKYDILIWPRE